MFVSGTKDSYPPYGPAPAGKSAKHRNGDHEDETRESLPPFVDELDWVPDVLRQKEPFSSKNAKALFRPALTAAAPPAGSC